MSNGLYTNPVPPQALHGCHTGCFLSFLLTSSSFYFTEARTGFEPVLRDLQSRASPLGQRTIIYSTLTRRVKVSNPHACTWHGFQDRSPDLWRHSPGCPGGNAPPYPVPQTGALLLSYGHSRRERNRTSASRFGDGRATTTPHTFGASVPDLHWPPPLSFRLCYCLHHRTSLRDRDSNSSFTVQSRVSYH